MQSSAARRASRKINNISFVYLKGDKAATDPPSPTPRKANELRLALPKPPNTTAAPTVHYPP
jgi:hypothetical protein